MDFALEGFKHLPNQTCIAGREPNTQLLVQLWNGGREVLRATAKPSKLNQDLHTEPHARPALSTRTHSCLYCCRTATLPTAVLRPASNYLLI